MTTKTAQLAITVSLVTDWDNLEIAKPMPPLSAAQGTSVSVSAVLKQFDLVVATARKQLAAHMDAS